jgi:hypothetical protein
VLQHRYSLQSHVRSPLADFLCSSVLLKLTDCLLACFCRLLLTPPAYLYNTDSYRCSFGILFTYTDAARTRVTENTCHMIRVRVRVTLRLSAHGQSVRLGVEPLETHDQNFFSQLNTCGHSPYITSFLTTHVIAIQPVHWRAGWTYRKHMSYDR